MIEKLRILLFHMTISEKRRKLSDKKLNSRVHSTTVALCPPSKLPTTQPCGTFNVPTYPDARSEEPLQCAPCLVPVLACVALVHTATRVSSQQGRPVGVIGPNHTEVSFL